MMFKKVYIEITNKCNLNCSFCSKTNRTLESISPSDFEYVINEVKKYTNYIYLHVLGEPLTHNKLDEILAICKKCKMQVNITTNGVFLKDKIDIIKNSNCVRQINISLHSENSKKNYIEDIVNSVIDIDNIYINYRFWTLKENTLTSKMQDYLGYLMKRYNTTNNKKLNNNTFISYDKEFVWPNTNNDYYQENGTCLGLKKHIGILVNGDVVVCCLDSNNESRLGNIYDNSLDSIINSEKAKRVIEGFNNNYAYLELCKHCSYKEKFNRGDV